MQQDIGIQNEEAEASSVASLPGEEWRPVPGYEGLYEVSSLGRVKSLERRTRCINGFLLLIPERILKPSRSQSGFLSVLLRRNGKARGFGVHVLVAQVFVEGRTVKKYAVHHKDGNPENNAASNLEWCGKFYGIGQKDVQARRVETLRRNRSWSNKPKPVELVHDGEVVARYASAQEAAKHEDICSTAIRNQCKGRSRSRTGYQWRYAEEMED